MDRIINGVIVGRDTILHDGYIISVTLPTKYIGDGNDIAHAILDVLEARERAKLIREAIEDKYPFVHPDDE